jgi:hypothetical protein
MPMIFLIISATTLKQQNMKRSRIFLIAVLFIAFASNAQITKGNWMMGGSASFGSGYSTINGIDSTVSTGFSIFPDVGYFVIDKLAVGANTNLQFLPSNIFYGFGPFIRYYFLEKEKPINVFSEVNYGIQGSNHSNDKIHNFNIKAGGVYFLNSSVGLEVALKYAKQMTTSIDYQTRGVSLNVGFQIHLEREK